MPHSGIEPKRRLAGLLRLRVLGTAGIVLLLFLLLRWMFGGGDDSGGQGTTFSVKRGDLPITIIEGGEAQSLDPHEVKCEVKGREVKILYIIEEGYRITKEDIENKKLLVELDSGELEQSIIQQELEYQSSKAALAKAQQDYDIQEKQNETDINAAEREAKFKAMDLRKLLGDKLANQLMDEFHLRRAAEEAATVADDAAVAAREAATAAEEAAKKAEETQNAHQKAEMELRQLRASLGLPEESPMAMAAGRSSERGPGPRPGSSSTGEERPSMRRREASGEGGSSSEGRGPRPERAPGAEGGADQERGPRPERAPGAEGGPGSGRRGPRPNGEARQDSLSAEPAPLVGTKGEVSSVDRKRIAKQEEVLREAIRAAEEAAQQAEERSAEASAATKAAAESAEAFKAAALAAKSSAPLPEAGENPTFTVTFKPFDFSVYAGHSDLEGEAAQKLSTLESDIMLGQEELIAAERKLEGTKTLHERDFKTDMELEAVEMAYKRQKINLESKQTSQDLYVRYEFPKLVEESFSAYDEALRKLERTRKEAETKIINAQVSLDSAQARYQLQKKEREDKLDQLTKCKIYATTEGLVVYGGSDSRSYRAEPISEGTTVYERMTILTIPDITQMAVIVKVHESVIDRVRKGQKATVRVEAFPDDELSGEVTKVSVLPSSQNRWMNPDLKVYETTVSVNGTHDWLKPGMTAEVEIHIKTLNDVLYVPLQAVGTSGDDRVCYLDNGDSRVVETGEFTDKYIEIKSGLEEGDVVLLNARDTGEEETEEEEPSEEGEEAASPPPTAG